MSQRIQQVDTNFQAPQPDDTGLAWYTQPHPGFELRGFPWMDENQGRFCRLPLRAESVVRPEVWWLAQATAGGRVCFASDTSRLAVRVDNGGPAGLTSMSVVGQGGLMAYAGPPGAQQPITAAFPPADQTDWETLVVQDLPPAEREWTLYLPLYNGVRRLEIGIDAGASLGPVSPPALPRPVVFYGTSITQGACAGVPGSDYAAAVCRALNLDFVNLGFSGNGRGEPEVARLAAEIDACLFVLDYGANVDSTVMADTLPGFVGELRNAHADTPILLASQISFWSAAYRPNVYIEHERKRDAVIAFYADARRAGDANLHFVDGQALVPFGDTACYVDGVHPNDHGFALMAERLAPFIRKALYPPAPPAP